MTNEVVVGEVSIVEAASGNAIAVIEAATIDPSKRNIPNDTDTNFMIKLGFKNLKVLMLEYAEYNNIPAILFVLTKESSILL